MHVQYIVLFAGILMHTGVHVAARFNNFRLSGALMHAQVSTDQAECKDGVCSVKPASGKSDNADKVEQLVKMGWKAGEAEKALAATNFNVEEAAAKLEEEDEENEVFEKKVAETTAHGWTREASAAALRLAEGNVTSAQVILEKEEEGIVANFEKQVKEMMGSGWDEVVARQALMAQWGIDQRKAMGHNVTRPSAEAIAAMKPSLKKPVKKDTGGKSAGPGGPGEKDIKPAKKEDCVFEVNANNFQKLVLESPVPVVLDIYADWCGPCKQLGPLLENAAMKSGGMFRLAKVNSDNERAIAEALDVQGLPTVFSVNNGKFQDRFVGMLPTDQLQQFLVRCATGYGDRVQTDISETGLAEASMKMSRLAGLASIGFKKKEKIYALVNSAMDLPGSFEEETVGEKGKLSESVKIALMYIDNASKDVRNPKFRRISQTSKAFSQKIAHSEAATKLLDLAGFKLDTNSSTAEAGPADLVLAHFNSALLTLVSQRVHEISRQKRFSKLHTTKVEITNTKSFRSAAAREGLRASAGLTAKPKAKAASSTAASPKSAASAAVKERPKVKTAVKQEGYSVQIRTASGESLRKTFKSGRSKNVREVIDSMMKGKGEWNQIEVKYPLPVRTLSRDDEELDGALESMGARINVFIPDQSEDNGSKKAKKSSGLANLFKKKKSEKPVKSKSKSADLYSSGILKAEKTKHNTYFGGDSTLTIAGDEDEEDDDDDDMQDDYEDEEEDEYEEEEED